MLGRQALNFFQHHGGQNALLLPRLHADQTVLACQHVEQLDQTVGILYWKYCRMLDEVGLLLQAVAAKQHFRHAPFLSRPLIVVIELHAAVQGRNGTSIVAEPSLGQAKVEPGVVVVGVFRRQLFKCLDGVGQLAGAGNLEGPLPRSPASAGASPGNLRYS